MITGGTKNKKANNFNVLTGLFLDSEIVRFPGFYSQRCIIAYCSELPVTVEGTRQKYGRNDSDENLVSMKN